MKTTLLLLVGALTAGALSSCGSCNCNSYDRDLLYGSPVDSSRSFN
ncbi:MAG TPA: hypothetical protein H9862_03925 [Candidatus Akkermansia intestinigallinarum]|uniref:Uncharacterized protein n=1 Tax=Candidatus Akkermansia intestinigallinarum TaxID=2838431 RepID=A0A9D1VBI1_9BACT|nr:hypothetical protein [Candidatus Akkermansia intestinigallinarum]